MAEGVEARKEPDGGLRTTGPFGAAFGLGPDLGPVRRAETPPCVKAPPALVMLEALERLWEAPHAAKPCGDEAAEVIGGAVLSRCLGIAGSGAE